MNISVALCCQSFLRRITLRGALFFLAASTLHPSLARAIPAATAQSKSDAQPDANSEVLDNAAIVRMVHAKLGASVILNAIRDQPGHYSVTANSLIRLSAAGVPQSVIEAMQAKAGGAHAAPSAEASTSEASAADTDAAQSLPQKWEIASRVDKMTGAPSVQATVVIPVDEGASVRVTASCYIDPTVEGVNDMPNQMASTMHTLMEGLSSDAPKAQQQESLHLDARTLSLQLRYLPKPGSGVALRSSAVVQTATRNAFSNDVTITPARSCVFMRVTVNGTGRKGVASSACGVQNLASVDFPSIRARDLMGVVSNASDNQALNKFAATFLNAAADANDPTVALMKEALGATEILVGLPLTDGESTTVSIHPQDPKFQQFVSKCMASFPDPPKPEVVVKPGGPFGIRVVPTTFELASRASRSPVVVNGLEISQVYADSPASRAGIVRGDVITQVNYKPVSSEEDLRNAVMHSGPPSGRATVSVYRDGRMSLFQITPNRIPADASSATTAPNAEKQLALSASAAPPMVAPASGTSTYGASGLAGRAAPLNSEFPMEGRPDQPKFGVKTGQELLTALDNSLWIADGASSDKQVYVIAGPCCGYSQALYHDTRNRKGVQLRWVEMAPTRNPKCLGYLGEIAMGSDPSELVAMYETLAEPRAVQPALRDNAIQVNGSVERAVYGIVKALNPEPNTSVQYPTLVWLSPDGVRVAVRPKNIDAILASVASRPEVADNNPMGRSFLNATYQYQSIPQKMFLAKNDGAPLYAFPDAKSQLVYTLPKDGGYSGNRRVTVAGEKWIEVMPQGPGAAGLFVREAEVYPAR